MGFALRDGLSFCAAGDRVVFLDLADNRYFALRTPQAEAFRRWALGNLPTDGDPSQLLWLERNNILTRQPQNSRPASQSMPDVQVPRSKIDVSKLRPMIAPIVHAIVARFIWSRRVKRWPLSRLLDVLGPSATSATLNDSPRNEAALKQMVRAFRISDLVLGSHDQCLVRSLALVATCRKRGLHCKLVIGVQPNPFAAHCWAQNESSVLNETPDRALMFTPILVA
ncbi:hypothetical protein FG91_03572 [Sphingopyxis sp. LC81]|uniref:lasso peptide biosynthesis B2 protein n=1 Tax=Sphingopyxis sp. LC81 TaxID=1502850 RepID=UPI00050FDF81|nr:lasso peptide biosynthesis B2 protein [Sphingopyxis sp. LC81]KGB52295.1 hypothetical protein FG91_03572 [Sphingopyxis sp. LC81]